MFGMSYLGQITTKSSSRGAWEAVLSEVLGPAQSLLSGFNRRGGRLPESNSSLVRRTVTGSFDHLSPDGSAAGRGWRMERSGMSKRDLSGTSLFPRQNRMAFQ